MERANDTDEQFRALANPTRRALLTLIRDDSLPVGQLAEAVGASQPATSQHLAVLRDAGLVSVTPSGRQRLYRADTEALLAARRFFDEYGSTAVDRLARVAASVITTRQEAS